MTQNALRTSTLAVLMSLAALVAPPVLAQEAEEGAQEIELRATEIVFVEGSLPYVPESSTIVAKLPVPLAMTPANVGLVTRGLFLEQGGTVLGNALTNVSNVNVQPGFGVHDYFTVRGFDSLSSSLILTDGAPEPEVTYYQLYNVELVEVLKGPGGFLYGSNPLAGTVNLVRKQPVPVQRLDLGVGYGSFDTFEGTLDGNWGRPDGPFAVRLNGLYRNADSWRDGKQSEVWAINPAVTWNVAPDHEIVANFESLSSNFSPDAGIPLVFGEVAGVPRGNDYNTGLDRSEQDVLRFQVDYQGRLSDAITLRNKFYVRSLDWLSDGTLINGAVPNLQWTPIGGGVFVPTPDGTFSVSRTFITLDDRQRLVGNQLEMVASFDTGTVHHELLGGVELTRLKDAFDLVPNAVPSVDLVDPVDDVSYVIPYPGQDSRGEPRSMVWAPYVIDQIAFSDRFQMLAGARFDSIDFDDPISGRGRSDSEVSPMVGAVYAPSGTVSVYGNWSRSFAPPSPRALGSLEPERSEQFEAGLKLTMANGRARATAAVYQLDRENIAIPDDNGFTQQVGNQRSRGFEVELLGEIADGLRGTLSYAYNDAELTRFSEQVLQFTGTGFVPVVIDRSGNRPAFAPEHLLSAWLSKTFDGGFGVALGARYVGDQFIAEDNAFTMPSAFLMAGSVSYQWRGYRLAANFENLLDNAIYTRGFGSQSVIPGAPFAATVRLSAGF